MESVLIECFRLERQRRISSTDRILSEDERNQALLRNSCIVAKNAVILDLIFGFLQFSDLKSCRLVCTDWELISKRPFERQTKVKLGSPLLGPADVEQFYKHYKKSKLVIYNYELCESKFLSSVFVRTFTSIIIKTGFLLTSLKLDNVSLFKKIDHQLKEFDLTDFLGVHLKSLTVISSKDTTMIISQENLVSTEYLHLNNCKLFLSRKSKYIIRPKVVHFDRVKFYECLWYCNINIPTLANYSLNFNLWPEGLINFTRLSKATITNGTSDIFFTIQFDEDSKRFVSLTVKKFAFSDQFFLNSKCLEPLTKLTIVGNVTSFLWSHLPETLETLIIEDCCSELPNPLPTTLPNLKELHYKNWNLKPFLTNFSSHPRLSKVRIHNTFAYTRDYDLNWISPRVRELHLKNINLVRREREDFDRELETLTLINNTSHQVLSITRLFLRIENLHLVNVFPSNSTFWKIFARIYFLPVTNVSVEMQNDYKKQQILNFLNSYSYLLIMYLLLLLLFVLLLIIVIINHDVSAKKENSRLVANESRHDFNSSLLF